MYAFAWLMKLCNFHYCWSAAGHVSVRAPGRKCPSFRVEEVGNLSRYRPVALPLDHGMKSEANRSTVVAIAIFASRETWDPAGYMLPSCPVKRYSW